MLGINSRIAKFGQLENRQAVGDPGFWLTRRIPPYWLTNEQMGWLVLFFPKSHGKLLADSELVLGLRVADGGVGQVHLRASRGPIICDHRQTQAITDKQQMAVN